MKKEYTLENFVMDETICTETGNWQNGIFSDGKEWSINLSGILDRLIKIAARVCEYFASDLFIDWKFNVDANMKNYDFDGGKILFGFRDSGVDGNSYVLSRINNYGKEGMEKEIKELYMMEFFVEKQHGYFEDTGTIRCKFGTVKVVEN